MSRRLAVVALALACAGIAVPTAGAVPRTKRQAERAVLRLLPRFPQRKAIAPLIDATSGLLKDNVQVLCKGRGKRYRGQRRASFVCVVRPAPRRGVVARLSYRALPSGRFHIHWLGARK